MTAPPPFGLPFWQSISLCSVPTRGTRGSTGVPHQLRIREAFPHQPSKLLTINRGPDVERFNSSASFLEIFRLRSPTVEASDLKSVQCGCNSRRSYHFQELTTGQPSEARQMPLGTRRVSGANQPHRLRLLNDWLRKSGVGCKSPELRHFSNAHVAQLAEAPVLETGGWGCKSLHGYRSQTPPWQRKKCPPLVKETMSVRSRPEEILSL